MPVSAHLVTTQGEAAANSVGKEGVIEIDDKNDATHPVTIPVETAVVHLHVVDTSCHDACAANSPEGDAKQCLSNRQAALTQAHKPEMTERAFVSGIPGVYKSLQQQVADMVSVIPQQEFVM
eukprot:1201929-Amphidinium_carterae.1